ncbi:hypothetical protein PAXINDRAFT_21675 [Paxillus involutus ATCC 200175]|uniref:DUF6532 domain-containing protein n=1 Tax=Paxillus involutus ATCC 200175 TaxID=664439 RepID=A0A0C9ST01_PAXIN|nr:hypothetical protein PAXINDRAFT_21675 [Paxillus involutus ATCC 200175]
MLASAAHATRHVFAQAPRRPNVQVIRPFNDRAGGTVIRANETTSIRRARRELRVPMPPTPPLAGQPLHSTASSAPTPIPEPTAAPVPTLATSHPNPATNPAPTKKLEKRQIAEIAREKVLSHMLNVEAISTKNSRLTNVKNAIRTAALSLTGGVPPDLPKLENDLTNAMASVRRDFRRYAACRVQDEFGLRLALDDTRSETDHKKTRVKELLRDLNYLRSGAARTPPPPLGGLFTTKLLTDIVIDVLFLSSSSLYKFIQDDNLDVVFALASAAIYSALKDHRTGYYEEYSVSNDMWRDPYLEVREAIEELREDTHNNIALINLQAQIMARGRSLLKEH